MDEAAAWLGQAIADHKAAEHLAADPDRYGRCQAIAKWQQAVEKAFKSLIAALRDAGIVHIEIGYGHTIERFLDLLIRLPHAGTHTVVQRKLRGFLDQQTRAGIAAFDGLVPKRPPPGQQPGRNTEYPYHVGGGQWTYPAAQGVFSSDEFQRFRALAYRVVERIDRLVADIRRTGKAKGK